MIHPVSPSKDPTWPAPGGKESPGEAPRASHHGAARSADGIVTGAIAQISSAGRQASLQAAATPGQGVAAFRPRRPVADLARDAKREIRFLFEQGLVFADDLAARQAEIADKVSQEAAPVVAAANRAAALLGHLARPAAEEAAHLLRDAAA